MQLIDPAVCILPLSHMTATKLDFWLHFSKKNSHQSEKNIENREPYFYLDSIRGEQIILKVSLQDPGTFHDAQACH